MSAVGPKAAGRMCPLCGSSIDALTVYLANALCTGTWFLRVCGDEDVLSAHFGRIRTRPLWRGFHGALKCGQARCGHR